MSKKPKTSSKISSDYPLLIESGTEEYQSKKRIEIERIDHRGIFRRSRVMDQTQFDRLFIEDKITRTQYSAAELYMHLMTVAGCFLKSPSLEPGIKTNGRDVSGAMAGKILVIASARESLRQAGEDSLVAVETCISTESPVDLVSLRQGLDALAFHFRL